MTHTRQQNMQPQAVMPHSNAMQCSGDSQGTWPVLLLMPAGPRQRWRLLQLPAQLPATTH